MDEKILTGRPKETPFLGSPYLGSGLCDSSVSLIEYTASSTRLQDQVLVRVDGRATPPAHRKQDLAQVHPLASVRMRNRSSR
ncbi:MAG: hypothetical protein ACO363_04595 [Balneolaceae bacterium]